MKEKNIEMILRLGYLLIGISVTLILLGILFPALISTDKLPLWFIIPSLFGIIFLWYVMIYWLIHLCKIKKEIKDLESQLKDAIPASPSKEGLGSKQGE